MHNLAAIKRHLEERRDAHDFNEIKKIRDYCRYLVSVSNPDWDHTSLETHRAKGKMYGKNKPKTEQ